MRLRSAALLAIAGALMAGTATPAAARTGTAQTGTAPTGTAQAGTAQAGTAPTTWSADLAAGEAAGISVDTGTAVMDQARAFLAPIEDDAAGSGGTATEGAPTTPTGLLVLPPHRLDAVADRVSASVLGDIPAGSTATVDVRGRRATGGWTEWIPAVPTTEPSDADATPNMTVTLPEPTSQVQGRLVLTGVPGASPTVRGVEFTSHPTDRTRLSAKPVTERLPLTYRVFATREGLAGGTTANGHVIDERDHFVALPSRRALSPRGTSDYSVKVCAPTGRCAFAPVWDIGPWNTKDDYWNPSAKRQEWPDLPQGIPQAQAAYQDGHNGGKDQFDREVANPAGIDLGDGLFWDALGLENNAYVTVDYLWTGNVRLAKVVGDAPVEVRAAPDAAAQIVGIAAGTASVPVECALSTELGKWLKIGIDQYLDAAAVPEPGPVGPCAVKDATTTSPAVQPAGTADAERTTAGPSMRPAERGVDRPTPAPTAAG